MNLRKNLDTTVIGGCCLSGDGQAFAAAGDGDDFFAGQSGIRCQL